MAHQLGTNTGNGIRFRNGCLVYYSQYFSILFPPKTTTILSRSTSLLLLSTILGLFSFQSYQFICANKFSMIFNHKVSLFSEIIFCCTFLFFDLFDSHKFHSHLVPLSVKSAMIIIIYLDILILDLFIFIQKFVVILFYINLYCLLLLSLLYFLPLNLM